MPRQHISHDAVVFAAASTALAALGAVGSRTGVAAVKPVPMVLLGARVIRGTRRRSRHDTALLAGAVGFSMLGDAMMWAEEFTPPGDTRSTELTVADRRLRAGAASFAAAHACSLLLARRRGGTLSARGLLRRVPILLETATVVAVRHPAVAPVLVGYGPMLASMSTMTATVPSARRGGHLFLISDTVLINRRHLLRRRGARGVAEAAVLGTYCAAQWWLLTGLDPV